MKLSVCTDSVYGGLTTTEAMKEVHMLGLTGIEFWSWWDKDLEAINETRKELKMTITGICTKFISLTDPSQRPGYLEGLSETIAVAQRLECRMIISQVGNVTSGTTEQQKVSIIAGLRQASKLLEETTITLVIEPLNTTIDHVDYFLWSSDLASDILTAVNSPHIKMLYDFYHQQMMGEDLVRQSTQLIKQVGHVHLAGAPDRNEPDNGDINYAEILKTLKQVGYTGCVGLEYFPSSAIAPTLLKWQTFIRQL